MGWETWARTVVVVLAGCALSGCPKGLSNEELAELSARCKKELLVSTGVIAFHGFSSEQMANIEVVEEREGGRVADSFRLQGSPVSINYGEDRFTALLPRQLRTDSSYVIRVPGEPLHHLSQLVIGLAPHFSMMADGWGCDLESYVLDGELRHGKTPSIGRAKGSK